MQQLFYNLINNAIKFRKENSKPVINISSEKVKPSELKIAGKQIEDVNYYKISVADNGIGFDAKYAEDIFMVFKRLHSYQEFEGTSVGLSICKKIIDRHNGFITAHSKINEGSVFVVYLPEKLD